jgi:hypothetical protein
VSKQNPRPTVLKLSSFEVRSIPKKPSAPSLAYRRYWQDALRTKAKTEEGTQ